MTKKPKCPTLDEVEESLKILGVDSRFETVDERVLALLVKKWKTRKDKNSYPRINEIAAELGVTSAVVRSACVRHKEAKRLFVIKRGIYVPNMVKLQAK